MKAALVLFALAAGCSSCSQIPVVTTAVIDCTGSHAADVSALIASMKALLTGGGSWADVEQQALKAGEAVGGCALAELANEYLTPRPTPPEHPSAVDTQAARAALDDFRKQWKDNPTFHTTAADL